MTNTDFFIEDKLDEIFSFLDSIENESGVLFKPYFSSGPEEDLNEFLSTETRRSIYPLIWLLYPYKEKRNEVNVHAQSIRLIIAVDNSNQMLNKLRLENSYKKVLYPVYYNIRNLFKRARNIEVVDNLYEITKYHNYGDFKSETTTIWDAISVDFELKINKFCHGLK